MKKITFLLIIFIVLLFANSAWAFPARLEVKIPFQVTGKQGIALAGSEVSAYFLLENEEQKAIKAKIVVLLPPEMEPGKINSAWQVSKKDEQYLLQTQTALATKLDNWFDLVNLKIKKGTVPGRYPVEVIVSCAGEEKKSKQFVNVVDSKKMQSLLGIEALYIPTDENGKIDAKYKENTLILKETTPDFWRNLFQGGKKDSINLGMDFVPIAYLGIDVYNKSQEDASVLLTAQLLNPSTRKPVLGFALPSADSALKQEDKIYSLVSLTPGTMRVPLPLYGEVGEIKSGHYLLSANLKMLGSDKILAKKEIPVQVVDKDVWPARLVFLNFLIIVCALIFLLRKQKELLKKYKTKWFILISLFGTATFVTVNIPGTILMDLAHAFLGPFSFLLTGFFNQIVLYMLLISLITLIPRPGVIFLLTCVRILLNGIILGHFTPVTVLFYFSGAFLLEMALYLTGVTRKGKISENKFSYFILAVACGIADVISSYLNFQASIFLYRLYYAQWYINMYLLIDALCYTGIGVWAGLLLGKQLKKITTD